MKTKMRHTNNKREMKEEEGRKEGKTSEGESANNAGFTREGQQIKSTKVRVREGWKGRKEEGKKLNWRNEKETKKEISHTAAR